MENGKYPAQPEGPIMLELKLKKATRPEEYPEIEEQILIPEALLQLQKSQKGLSGEKES